MDLHLLSSHCGLGAHLHSCSESSRKLGTHHFMMNLLKDHYSYKENNHELLFSN
jgi:hypothetical protein